MAWVNTRHKTHGIAALLVKDLVVAITGAKHKHVIARAAKDDVVSAACGDHVIPSAPQQPVRRRAAADRVSTPAAIHHIALVAARNHVGLIVAADGQRGQRRDEAAQGPGLGLACRVAWIAGQFNAEPVRPQQGRCQGHGGGVAVAIIHRQQQVIALRIRAREGHAAPVRGAGQSNDVAALAVVYDAGAARLDHVGVIARIAVKLLGPGAGINRVVARTGMDLVCACKGFYLVIDIRALKVVVLRRAVDCNAARQQVGKAHIGAVVITESLDQHGLAQGILVDIQNHPAIGLAAGRASRAQARRQLAQRIDLELQVAGRKGPLQRHGAVAREAAQCVQPIPLRIFHSQVVCAKLDGVIALAARDGAVVAVGCEGVGLFAAIQGVACQAGAGLNLGFERIAGKSSSCGLAAVGKFDSAFACGCNAFDVNTGFAARPRTPDQPQAVRPGAGGDVGPQGVDADGVVALVVVNRGRCAHQPGARISLHDHISRADEVGVVAPAAFEQVDA